MLPLLGFLLVLSLQAGHVFGTANQGREFYVTYFYHDRGSTEGRNELILTSTRAANVLVECNSPSVNQTLYVPANGLVRYLLPGNVRVTGAGRANRGVRITSDEDITVHGTNAVDGTTGAFLAFPATDDALEFILASYEPLTTRYAQFVVVGTQDGTAVSVYKPRASGGHDIQNTFILNKMETFTFLTYTDDYTGWLVRANRSVSVFSGHECANVPIAVSYCDMLVVNVPPVTNHGQLFITSPVLGRTSSTGYLIRPVAFLNGTVVTVSRNNVIESYTLEPGQFRTTEITPTNQYAKVNCSRPCMVIQYNKGGTIDSSGQDPFMATITPLNRYTNDVTFATSRRFGNQQFTNYLNIVVKNSSVSDLRLNNQTQTGRAWQAVADWDDYVTATFAITDGRYHLTTTDPAAQGRFSAIVQGHSVTNEESYAYQAGFGVDDSLWTTTLSTTLSTTRTTGSTPVPTLPPGSLEPALDIVVNGTYRTRDNSSLSAQCASDYATELQNRNLWMALHINDMLGVTMCPADYRGTLLYTADVSFISLGAEGRARVGVLLPGKLTLTFDQMHNCGREISRYIQVHDNWGKPIIPQLPGCPFIDFIPETFNHYDWIWKCLS